jgi:hypothetical protein
MTLLSEASAKIAAGFTSANKQWPLMGLALASSFGVIFAIVSLTGDIRESNFDDLLVASVNGVGLDLTEYQRAVQLFNSEKKFAVNQADKSLILQRMIEEELLVQHGVESGLVRRNQSVRAEVLRSVIVSLTTELKAGALDSGAVERQQKAQDDRLVEYIGHLRQSATIRWSSESVQQ